MILRLASELAATKAQSPPARTGSGARVGLRGLAAASSLALLAACVAPVPVARTGGATSGDDARIVFEGINRHRASRGCAPLVWSDGAARAARLHSADMARRGFFSHTSPDGAQPWDRLRAQGLTYTRAAENIARTGAGPQDAVRGWINSAGHRANIENCQLTHTGVGVAGSHWTQLFFTPRSP